MITVETARFLLWLVGQQQLTAGAPDFEEAVEKVLRAKLELQAIIDGE